MKERGRISSFLAGNSLGKLSGNGFEKALRLPLAMDIRFLLDDESLSLISFLISPFISLHISPSSLADPAHATLSTDGTFNPPTPIHPPLFDDDDDEEEEQETENNGDGAGSGVNGLGGGIDTSGVRANGKGRA